MKRTSEDLFTWFKTITTLYPLQLNQHSVCPDGFEVPGYNLALVQTPHFIILIFIFWNSGTEIWVNHTHQFIMRLSSSIHAMALLFTSFIHSFILPFFYRTDFKENVCSSLFSSKTWVPFYLKSTRESGLGTNPSRLSTYNEKLQHLKFCFRLYPCILLYGL